MAVIFSGYSQEQNESFFSGEENSNPLPVYYMPQIIPQRGPKPVCLDNRAVRAWLLKTGCNSFSQLADAYPDIDDVFSGCSKLDGSSSSNLPYSKALIFQALTGMDEIHRENVEDMYYQANGKYPSPRYIRYATDVIQVTSQMVHRYTLELEDSE